MSETSLWVQFKQHLYLMFHPVQHIELIIKDYRALSPRGRYWFRRMMALASVVAFAGLFFLPPVVNQEGVIFPWFLARILLSFLTGLIVALAVVVPLMFRDTKGDKE